MGQGGGGAQSLESLRLRLLAAREAAPGQALLLALLVGPAIRAWLRD